MKKRLCSVLLLLAACLALQVPAAAWSLGDGPAAAMSLSHAAYLDSEGVLWTWGRGRCGELGNGSQEDAHTPVKIMEEVASVSVSDGVTAAVKRDGTLWMWGSNYHGQLGNGGQGDQVMQGTSFDHNTEYYIQTTPVQVLDQVAAVYTANLFTAAIRTDGSLWMWGDNQYGHLGFPGGDRVDRYDYVYQTTPKKVMDGVASLAIGEDANSVAAIRTDGSLWMWGSNQYGQLGNGGGGNSQYEVEQGSNPSKFVDYQTEPVKVMDGVRAVSIGANHTAAIRTDGSLWTWGSNRYGQLGCGSTESSGVPVQVLEGAAAVSLGWSSTAALKTDGTLWTWGRNSDGQLGCGSTEDSHTPVQVLEDVAAVGSDRDCRFALKTDGSLWAWGWNRNGQLGCGSRENVLTPVQVLDRVSAAVGGQTSLAAIRQDRTLWAWGDNYYGQLGNGTRDGSPVPVHILGEEQLLPFTDVAPTDWFYGDVGYVCEKGLMRGDGSETLFHPDGTTTRAMLVTILYRIEGKPGAESSGFSDVPEGQWYTDAVAWAAASGIVNGSGGRFYPMDAVTRQDFAAILYRYAGRYKGYDVSARADLAGFSDAGEAADYAAEALQWAGAEGLINGSGGRLDPRGRAVRAQAAAILARFCERQGA